MYVCLQSWSHESFQSFGSHHLPGERKGLPPLESRAFSAAVRFGAHPGWWIVGPEQANSTGLPCTPPVFDVRVRSFVCCLQDLPVFTDFKIFFHALLENILHRLGWEDSGSFLDRHVQTDPHRD